MTIGHFGCAYRCDRSKWMLRDVSDVMSRDDQVRVEVERSEAASGPRNFRLTSSVVYYCHSFAVCAKGAVLKICVWHLYERPRSRSPRALSLSSLATSHPNQLACNQLILGWVSIERCNARFIFPPTVIQSSTTDNRTRFALVLFLILTPTYLYI